MSRTDGTLTMREFAKYHNVTVTVVRQMVKGTSMSKLEKLDTSTIRQLIEAARHEIHMRIEETRRRAEKRVETVTSEAA